MRQDQTLTNCSVPRRRLRQHRAEDEDDTFGYLLANDESLRGFLAAAAEAQEALIVDLN